MLKKMFMSVVCGTAAALATHAGVTPEAALDAVVFPNADACMQMKGSALNGAFARHLADACWQFMEDAGGKHDGVITLLEVLGKLQQLGRKAGITRDNVELYVNSGRTAGVYGKMAMVARGEALAPVPVQDVPQVVAVKFKKPVTLDALRTLAGEVVRLAADQCGVELDAPVCTGFSHGGVSGFTLQPGAMEKLAQSRELREFLATSSESPVTFALLGGGRVVYAGYSPFVKETIDRANAGRRAEPSAEVKRLLASRVNGRPAASYDYHAVQAVPGLFATQAHQLRMLNVRLNGSEVLAGLLRDVQATCAVFDTGDEVNGGMRLVFATPEQAAQARTAVDYNFLSLFKVILYQLTGQNIPAIRNLTAETDGTALDIRIVLTRSDTDDFFKGIKKITGAGRAD